MCGIAAIISEKDFLVIEHLIRALKKMEYRGYDSAGFSTFEGRYIKRVGQISVLEKDIPADLKTSLGIAHTRWATHGGVTENNAHPHTNSNNSIFLVHNGIIENFEEFKRELIAKGYIFLTQTDTEIIVHFIEEQLKNHDIFHAMREFIKKAKGTYAVVFFIRGKKELYVMKKDSPMCLGIGDGEMILASDIYAFSHITSKVIFFEDNEYGIIRPKSCEFYNLKGRIRKKVLDIPWEKEDVSKQDFEHFMLKEVYEEPFAVKRALHSIRIMQKAKMIKLAGMIKESKRVLFIACGTSYHAALIGAYCLSRIGIEAHAVIASEFENFSIVDLNTLVIAVSQSGETMDIITVLKRIMKRKPRLASIVNHPYSTIQRMSQISIEMSAGQEICVGATKTFVNSLIVLYELARILGNGINLDNIPEKIKYSIEKNEKKILETAKLLKCKKDIFILGNKVSYPLAREFALKLKEIAYVHAEGMMAGELKHGTIALVEKGIPIFGLIHESNQERMDSALTEVEARGAVVFRIGGSNSDFIMPENLNEEEFSACATTIGYLISYHIAKLKQLPIDKPRNLAKSVTVK